MFTNVGFNLYFSKINLSANFDQCDQEKDDVQLTFAINNKEDEEFSNFALINNHSI